MEFDLHIQNLRVELDRYYSTFDTAEERLMAGLKRELEKHPEESSYARKSRMHEFLCRTCPVKIFRHLPLFFEMSSGRGRFSWGGLQSNVGSYLHISTEEHWLKPYGEALAKDRDEGFLHGWNNPVGFDHHCAGYDNLLAQGLNGIIARAEEKLADCTDEKQRDFYSSVIRSNRALIELARRFSEEARRLGMLAHDEEEQAH